MSVTVSLLEPSITLAFGLNSQVINHTLPWRFLVSDHPKCFFISSQILPMVALWSIRRATWTAVFFSSKFKGSTFVENVPNLRCHPVLSFILIFLDWALSAAFLTNFSYRQSLRVSVIVISFSYPTPPLKWHRDIQVYNLLGHCFKSSSFSDDVRNSEIRDWWCGVELVMHVHNPVTYVIVA